jgi:hypothetical protein
VHPIERLRYVARSSGGDQRTLVEETAAALRGLGLDHAGLVVACRRILQRHPSSGPLWWLCASVLNAGDPLPTARRLAEDIEHDRTPEALIDALAPDSSACVVGWPDLAGEAVLRRGDVRAVVVDVADGSALARRLGRADVEVDLVGSAGVAAAVDRCQVVLIEVLAATPASALATTGSRVAAAAAYCAGVPVWGVVGRGRCLPEPLFAELVARSIDDEAPWDSPFECVPTDLFTELIRPDGRQAVDAGALAPECPHAPELLRTGIM